MKKNLITAIAVSVVITGMATSQAKAMTLSEGATAPVVMTEAQTMAPSYFLFKNIWGGDSLQLAFDGSTMTMQATAKSGHFSNANENFTLQLIDQTTAVGLVKVEANTKYVQEFVNKVQATPFQFGDIVALTIAPNSGLANPTLYVNETGIRTDCVGKTQYFEITPEGLQAYTPNIQLEPLKILGQGFVQTATLSGTTYPNSEVTVHVNQSQWTTKSDANGEFQVDVSLTEGFSAQTEMKVQIGELHASFYPQLAEQSNMHQTTKTGYEYVLNADLATVTTPFPAEILYGRELLSESGQKAWDIAYAALLNYDNTADSYPRDSAGNVEFYVDYESHGIEISKTEAQYIQSYLVKNEPRMFLLKDWSATPVYNGNVIVGQKFYIGNGAQNGNDYHQQLLATEQTVSEILSKLTPEMDIYQILRTLQTEYQRAVSYKNAGTPGDIRGSFINRYAICGGYAKGYEYLLQRVGIQNIWVAGDTSEGYHAWNHINVYGNWYLSDSTWGTHMKGTNDISNHRPRNTYHEMPTLAMESIPTELGTVGQTLLNLTGIVTVGNHNDGQMTITYQDPEKRNTTMQLHPSTTAYEAVAMTRNAEGHWQVTLPYDAAVQETIDFYFSVDGKFQTIGNVQAEQLTVQNVGKGMRNIVVATTQIDRATLQAFITETNYVANDYTPTSFAAYTDARENAQTVVDKETATQLELAQAYRQLKTAITELIQANKIEFKGYNNVVFLTLEFDTINQKFKAVSNGKMVHPYQYSRVYSLVEHFDQKGNLKGSYRAIADQTADAMAEGLNNADYAAGDYLKISHLEKNNRLVIKGHVEAAPYDLSTGAYDLDLANSYFYLGGESLAYTDHQLDLSADKSALQAKITEMQAIRGDGYTKTSFAQLQAVIAEAGALVASPSVFDAEIKAAIAALETAHAELKALNMIVFKGYNNNEFLKLGFDSEQQQFIAEANGQVANKYSNGTYASIKHYDQAGNLKATYSVQANQTADAVVAQLNGAAYESGDYLQLAHKEQAQRLAIMGYVEAAPADFTNGVQSLDLTTARFYLDGESFKFSSEALDYTADTTALQALIAEVDALEATNYTPTSYQAVVTAREAAQVIVETFNVTAAQVQAASEQLQQAVSELRLKNEIQIKGYNNEIGLTISFEPETQTLHATTNGKIVHPYFGGTYASIKHYDQQGVLKATYNVLATQTADAVAAQIEGTSYETGDYFQITHKEPTKRLAITGYIEAAPADFSNGVQSLDLTTARFYLDGESFKFSSEALDYTADTTALQALIAEVDALEAINYTATSYQAVVTAREAAQAIVETFNVTAARVQAASEQLQQAVSELRITNTIQIKGYNSEIALAIHFEPITQTLHAVANGKTVHPYVSGTYASIKHYDQAGNLKATYNVMANQTADAIAGQIEGTSYEAGDYLQLTHKEQANRLAITGYIEAAPADFTNGVQSLDLTTARFYLGGESFTFSNEA